MPSSSWKKGGQGTERHRGAVPPPLALLVVDTARGGGRGEWRRSEAPPGGSESPSVSRRLFFNDTATTEIYNLSLHDALPISDATAFADWLAPLRKCEWVVYAKRPFA